MLGYIARSDLSHIMVKCQQIVFILLLALPLQISSGKVKTEAERLKEYGAEKRFLTKDRKCREEENERIFISSTQCGMFYTCEQQKGKKHELFKYVCPGDQSFNYKSLRCSQKKLCTNIINTKLKGSKMDISEDICDEIEGDKHVAVLHFEELKCDEYISCDAGSRRQRCAKKRIYNEYIHKCDPKITCAEFEHNSPIDCDEENNAIWTRDPDQCDRAWYCSKDKNKPMQQYCQYGTIFATKTSDTFSCVPGSVSKCKPGQVDPVPEDENKKKSKKKTTTAPQKAVTSTPKPKEKKPSKESDEKYILSSTEDEKQSSENTDDANKISKPSPKQTTKPTVELVSSSAEEEAATKKPNSGSLRSFTNKRNLHSNSEER